MTVLTADSLAAVSEDEIEERNDAMASKPKSIKKKKKKKVESDDNDDGTAPTAKSKKKKKKKSSSSDDDDDDEGDDLTSNTKPKSIKKKKTSISTQSTRALSDDELSPDQKPKSTRKTKAPQAVTSGPVSLRGVVAPGRSGRGRGPPGGRTNGMNISGHNPHHRAPMRPQGMSIGGRGPSGALSSGSSHNPAMSAPSRPTSMVHGGRGGRGGPGGRGGRSGRFTGRGGSSMRSSLHGGSAHGGGGIGQGSSHGNRPTGQPASILRTSMHGGGGRGAGAVIVGPDGSIRHLDTRNSSSNLGGGSMHRSMGASGRFASKMNYNAPKLDRSNSIDSFDIDNDDIEDDFPDKDTGNAVVTGFPEMVGNISKSIRNMMDMSVHSGLGAGGMSSHEPSGDRRYGMKRGLSQFNASTRSILTLEWENPEESYCIRTLRYIRLMSPHPDEKPLKKKIRVVTWVALVLDFLAAVVAITTYGGVTTCCGEPMMNVAGNFPWEKIITAVTYLYIILIIVEVLPVVRDTFPFNLLNPLVGFLITFAVFFDDSVVQAAIMWVIETMAVSCEVYIFRLRSLAYKERVKRLEKTDDAIKNLRNTKKKIKQLYESGKNLNISNHSMGSCSYDGESDDSFHDETGSKDDMTTGGKSTGTDISKVRENKLYRERRVLRESNANDRRHLRYHLIGVCVNCFLVCLSLLIICVISKNKGLCIVDMEAPNVFQNNQLERCFDCQGVQGMCEVCREDGTSHCYYPYG